MGLVASFVRHRGRRDRVYVTRIDGTTTGWDFPSYGDRLPHDLCHLVVEDALGIADGFWGLVDRGVDVAQVRNQATLIRDGLALKHHRGIDFTGLMRAEAAVALLIPAGSLNDPVDAASAARLSDLTEQEIDTVRRRLCELDRRWRDLHDGGAIEVTFRHSGSSADTGSLRRRPRRGSYDGQCES